jgi:hypothetical protein
MAQAKPSASPAHFVVVTPQCIMLQTRSSEE